MDEVHRPGLVRSRRRPAIVPQLGLHPPLGRFVAQLQAQFAVDAPRLVLAVATTFASEQGMNAPITVAHPCPANLPDPLFEDGLSGATGLVMIGGGIDFEYAAGPPD